jgi:hypothetical protein
LYCSTRKDEEGEKDEERVVVIERGRTAVTKG